ncbi:MAG: TonB-dependent receptor [Gemmatimonadales bacterium]
MTTTPRAIRRTLALTAFAAAAFVPSLASAQSPAKRADSTRARELDPINVTATRTPTQSFLTPRPVTVIDSSLARRAQAYTVADLFRTTPGVDITGVGSNQTRLAIRGQRGQRILLLENGIRLNNARRQQDFGELPALSDVESANRVELVRGPASVLYGTDAIGGVLNVISSTPPTAGPNQLHGEVSYRYSSHDSQQRPAGSLSGRFGGVGFRLSASYRDTDPYRAPAGRFGAIELGSPVLVHDTGVLDANYAAEIAVPVGSSQTLDARFSRYEARHAGFGYVAGADLGETDAPLIRITYPDQRFNQLSLRYSANALQSAVADRLEVTTYYQSNARDLSLDIFIPFGPGTPPGAGVSSISRNYTDLDTFGGRIEAVKILGSRHTLTYGVDFFTDDSFNRDSSETAVIGFGPPDPEVSVVPPVPNASFRSAGAFAQLSLALTDRLTTVVGARVQDIRAATKTTAGITDPLVSGTDRTVVGAANLLYQVSPALVLIGSAGRAFRSPNLVERFFNGPTPEGSGFQVRNPDLEPETSVNFDVGARVRSGPLFLEGFYYRSTIRNGIRIEPTGEDVGPFPAYRNVNVEKIHDQGVELAGGIRTGSGFGLSASFAHHSAEDALDPTNPIGDTFSTRVGGEARYDDPSGRFWAAYAVRHNGTRKDVELGDNVLGSVLPAFTVHDVAAGARLGRWGGTTHSLALTVANLTDRLYAEFPNASFFRPEPGRRATVTYRLGF